MIPRARPRVDAMKRGRRENENGGRGDGGYTQGGNVLINGRAPPLPRGRINIFGCSNACKKAVEREREREVDTRGWRRPKHVAARAASRAPQN